MSPREELARLLGAAPQRPRPSEADQAALDRYNRAALAWLARVNTLQQAAFPLETAASQAATYAAAITALHEHVRAQAAAAGAREDGLQRRVAALEAQRGIS